MMTKTRKQPIRRKRPTLSAASQRVRRDAKTKPADVPFLGAADGGTPTAPISVLLRLSQIDITTGINPRMAPGDLEQLTASIKEQGLLQPLVVRPAKGRKCHLHGRSARFEVVAGERRLRSLRSLKWKHAIPVLVRMDLEDDDRAHAVAVAENSEEGRHNLNLVEVHRAVWRLSEAGWSNSRIASETGLHRQTVHEAVKILKAPEELRRKAAECDLTHHATLALAQVPDEDFNDVVTKVRSGSTALDIRRLRMDAATERTIENAAEEAEQEMSGRASPAAWRLRRNKQSSLRVLCRKIARLQDAKTDPYDVELLEARAMAWTLFWDRGDVSGDELPVAVPDPKSHSSKVKRELNQFEALIAREAAAASQDTTE